MANSRFRRWCLVAGLSSCLLWTPSTAAAFHLSALEKALFGMAVQYNSFNQMLAYYDNEGRDTYFEKLKNEYGVDHNEQKNAILHDVMQRLSKSYATKYPDVEQKPYNYFINKKKTFNAFCTFGHNISVNTGLFKLLNNNPDEIAFVLAHEMGHGEEHHAAKNVRKSIPIAVIASVESANSDSYLKSLGIITLAKYAEANVVTKPQEWQADNDAFTYATAAGFNPGAGAAVWQRFMEKMPSNRQDFVGEIFSPNDHPTPLQRRTNYAEKLTQYSKGHVTVKDGVVQIDGQEFLRAAKTPQMSAAERSYLIAGALAAVYHNNKVIPQAYVGDNGYLYVGAQDICLPVAQEPSAAALAASFNKINNI